MPFAHLTLVLFFLLLLFHPIDKMQCSGDTAFLEELLVDLWNEANAHMKQLREFIPEGDMLVSMLVSHSVHFGSHVGLLLNTIMGSFSQVSGTLMAVWLAGCVRTTVSFVVELTTGCWTGRGQQRFAPFPSPVWFWLGFGQVLLLALSALRRIRRRGQIPYVSPHDWKPTLPQQQDKPLAFRRRQYY